MVAFEDYPLGDLDAEVGGGGAGGSGSGGSGNDGGVRNEPAPSTSGSGSGAASGSDAVGGSPAGTGSSGAAAGGSGPMGGGSGGGSATAGSSGGDFAGMSGEGGAPSPDSVTVILTTIDDTYLSSSSRASNYGNEKTLIIDRNVGGDTHDALIRIALGTVPTGAQISAATLSLTCSRIGDPIDVSYIESSWQELTVHGYNAPTVGTVLTSAAPNSAGALVIDVAPAVTAWLAEAHDNYGLYLSLPGMTASECASSEALDEAARPRLIVTYTLP